MGAAGLANNAIAKAVGISRPTVLQWRKRFATGGGPPALVQDSPGRGRGTMTHDYKRHGTTTLFAALDVLEGP